MGDVGVRLKEEESNMAKNDKESSGRPDHIDGAVILRTRDAAA
jgi:hypothetical protein